MGRANRTSSEHPSEGASSYEESESGWAFRWETVQAKARAAVDHGAVLAVLVIATLYVLFADDIVLLAFSAEADVYHLSLVFVCFVLFVVELVASLVARPREYLAFFFWFDLITIISMIPDILLLFSSSDTTEDPDTFTARFSVLTIARAGRLARLGSRAGRLMRIIRIMVRVHSSPETDSLLAGHVESGATLATGSDLHPTARAVASDVHHSSIVGRKYTALLTRVFVLMVLVTVFAFVILETVRTPTPDGRRMSEKYGLDLLETAAGKPGALSPPANSSSSPFLSPELASDLKVYLGSHSDVRRVVLLGSTVIVSASIDNLRVSERTTLYSGSSASLVVVSNVDQIERDSMLNLIQTFIILVVLFGGSLVLVRTAQRMLIRPLEDMSLIALDLVSASSIHGPASHPQAASAQRRTSMTLVSKSGPGPDSPGSAASKTVASEKSSMFGTEVAETAVLVDVLTSLRALMHSGFGTLGWEVLNRHLLPTHELDFARSGELRHSALAVIDVSPFVSPVVVLKGAVAPMLNAAVGLTHNVVVTNGGLLAKMAGDSVISLWPCDTVGSRNAAEAAARDAADTALNASLRILSELARSSPLVELRNLAGIPPPSANTTLGRLSSTAGMLAAVALHLGWTVEAAIGSDALVEPLLLGPHADLSLYLRKLARFYNVPIVMSATFVACLSPVLRERARRIDRILLSTTHKALDIYTMDVLTPLSEQEMDLLRSRSPLASSAVSSALGHDPRDASLYATALEAYIEGRWREAKILFSEYADAYPDDGPAANIIDFIDEVADELGGAPLQWRGARLIVL
ncbi:uncharacterized protein AMSG_04530 [Thecamonas trahens ATCC 50062]|uniref:Guanylate cyclase domain-containing protein n=1 Tax=Thecamonas trahens ATCC 50062 TaxID=461836 RepID=A0A0L0D7G8_THETB|nr:hypothetical protein AMSG_04530 [Thecamonas trahens ATCC 50062]KNC48299.1 hypothetical protein AMSG_04530 [Thecamonas trahens ATCC 50062]|eukprot:XP_013758866.1 hypothetical protein AMSG_04530 [Thecamonas trahens ATCC 50062]